MAKINLAKINFKKPVDAFDYEVAQEMAGALGRLGRALERTLQALAEFDAARPVGLSLTGEARDRRQQHVREASRALWHFMVQREACGLRDTRQVLRDYSVPTEVRDRMGVYV
jgi:hypothetical protein